MAVTRLHQLSDYDDDKRRLIQQMFSIDRMQALQGLILSKYVLVSPMEPCVFATKFDGMDGLLENLRIAWEAYYQGVTLARMERKRRDSIQGQFAFSPRYDEVRMLIYRMGRDAISDTESRQDESCLINQTAGEQFAETALFRLLATYDSIAVLFTLGKTHDALALCRVFIEQLAWSLGVCFEAEDLEDATRVNPTKCIRYLKALAGDDIGRLYGELSKSIHLGITQHYSFLSDMGVVISDPRESLLCSVILLRLAGLWCACLETTQASMMTGQLWITKTSTSSIGGIMHTPESYSSAYAKMRAQVVEVVGELKPEMLNGVPTSLAFKELYSLLGYEFE